MQEFRTFWQEKSTAPVKIILDRGGVTFSVLQAGSHGHLGLGLHELGSGSVGGRLRVLLEFRQTKLGNVRVLIQKPFPYFGVWICPISQSRGITPLSR